MRCSRQMQTWSVAVLWVAMLGAATADGSGRSADTAGQLVAAMQAKNLDAFAAEDPRQPGRFVAAMLVPEVQLLVVAAETTAPEYLRAQLAQRDYREAYVTLHSAAVPATKVFFQDMGCNGLRDGDSSVDILYERAATQTVFDGDWKAQKLSKTGYQEKLQQADGLYAEALAVLTSALDASQSTRTDSSGT